MKVIDFRHNTLKLTISTFCRTVTSSESTRNYTDYGTRNGDSKAEMTKRRAMAWRDGYRSVGQWEHDRAAIRREDVR